ncbi:Glyco_tranf_GTA_type domain containing protein [Candidatus Planktophila versatilis]|uniref:glycosyltransferase family 2 protein n=1 Tax=Candidatus Planktophila versatilis TaxID=1884905 RepID=UPI003BEEDE46
MKDEDGSLAKILDTNRALSKTNFLSVIVPITKMAGRFENLESWLMEALECGIEVILVHDIQDEMTEIEIAVKFKTINHSKLKILEGKFESPGLTRNKGISESTGEWIAFWDADDVPNPRAAQSLLDLIQNQGGVELIVGSYEVISPSGQSLVEARDGDINGIAVNPGMWRMIFKRELMGGRSFSNSKMGEDQEFIASLKPWDLSIRFSKIVLYRYYFGGDYQLTSDGGNFKDLVHVTKRLINQLEISNSKANIFISTLIIRQIFTGFSRSGPKVKKEFVSIAALFTIKYVIFHPRRTASSVKNILKLRGK